MDFTKFLSKSYGKSFILVVVDWLSKYAYFYPLQYPYKAMNVVQLFLNNIFKLHGMTTTIISDRDPTFTYKFW